MYVNLGQLGTAQSTAEISGGVSAAGKAATNILSQFEATASAVPIVGAVVSVLASLVSLFHIGQGCGEACIDSASTEQIFEVAGWNVELAGAAGMITQAQAVAALQWLLQQGQSTMQSLEQKDSKAKAGLTNLTSTLQTQIEAVQSGASFTASDFSGDAGPSAIFGEIPVTAPTVELNPTQLEGAIFVQQGASGWYPNSVSQGASLALQAIAYATNQIQTASVAASPGSGSAAGGSSSIVATAEADFSAASPTTLLMVGAVVLGGVFFLSGNRPTKANPRP